ncbi:hypothetical protein, partial [Staphylococcus aureus]|uniref:hypothetical protein n=1 Tax=Staphylococcus aureus TaxID=1280 RepID=UPI0015B90B48
SRPLFSFLLFSPFSSSAPSLCFLRFFSSSSSSLFFSSFSPFPFLFFLPLFLLLLPFPLHPSLSLLLSPFFPLFLLFPFF